MIIEPTTDAEAIKSILALMEDELFEGGENAEVPMHPSIYYFIVREELFSDGAVEDRPVGVIAFSPVNSITWTPHMAILPKHRGIGTQALSHAVAWMFEHTPCAKLFGAPPAYNAAMIRVFEKCGFAREGVSPLSFAWHGKIHDRVLMGKEKH